MNRLIKINIMSKHLNYLQAKKLHPRDISHLQISALGYSDIIVADEAISVEQFTI
jgi:hypothetical protein